MSVQPAFSCPRLPSNRLVTASTGPTTAVPTASNRFYRCFGNNPPASLPFRRVSGGRAALGDRRGGGRGVEGSGGAAEGLYKDYQRDMRHYGGLPIRASVRQTCVVDEAAGPVARAGAAVPPGALRAAVGRAPAGLAGAHAAAQPPVAAVAVPGARDPSRPHGAAVVAGRAVVRGVARAQARPGRAVVAMPVAVADAVGGGGARAGAVAPVVPGVAGAAAVAVARAVTTAGAAAWARLVAIGATVPAAGLATARPATGRALRAGPMPRADAGGRTQTGARVPAVGTPVARAARARAGAGPGFGIVARAMPGARGIGHGGGAGAPLAAVVAPHVGLTKAGAGPADAVGAGAHERRAGRAWVLALRSPIPAKRRHRRATRIHTHFVRGSNANVGGSTVSYPFNYGFHNFRPFLGMKSK